MKKLDVPQSGSQASTTASRNRFGQYNRTRATPVNPNSARQVLVRARLAAASEAWRLLSDAERSAWNGYASTVGKVDSLGQTIYPSGHQRFVGLWSELSDAGLAVPPDVPTTSAAAAPNLSVGELIEGAGVELASTSTVSTTSRLVVFASPQFSAGVTFNKDFRFLQVFSAALSANLVDLTAAYAAKFGVPVLGRRIFFEAYLVSRAGGASAAAQVNGIVVVAS